MFDETYSYFDETHRNFLHIVCLSDILNCMTDDMQFRAMRPEEREAAEAKLDQEQNSDPMVCLGCGA